MFDWKRARLRGLHLVSALGLLVFLVLHIGNHIAGFRGQEAHVAYMNAARQIYRAGLVEPVLLALVAWQAVSGISLVLRGWRSRRGRVAWLQALSGLYLGVFLLNHAGAVLFGRWVLQLDTDFRFAAAGFHVSGWPLFFAPYYMLAVAALGAHLGCAGYWMLGARYQRGRKTVLGLGAVAGVALGLGIVAGMAGLIFPVSIDEAYLSMYR